MDEDIKRKLQIFLGIGVLLAGARTAYIFYERKQAAETPAKEATNVERHTLTADDNVYERPFYGYDMESTKRNLVGQTVWMKAGNYFHPAQYAGKRVGAEESRLIMPLEEMKVVDVVQAPSKDARKIYAVFMQEGVKGERAIPIGVQRDEQYRIDVSNILYLQDPRQLYKHWPKETWDAIDRHEALKGMNEQQVWLALGYGVALSSAEYGNRRMHYENAGRPKEVLFRDNAAVAIVDAKPLE